MEKITLSLFNAGFPDYIWNDREKEGEEGIIEREEVATIAEEPVSDAIWGDIEAWQKTILGIGSPISSETNVIQTEEAQPKVVVQKSQVDKKIEKVRQLIEKMKIDFKPGMVYIGKDGLTLDLKKVKLNIEQINILAAELNDLNLGSLILRNCGLQSNMLLPLVEPLKTNKTIVNLDLAVNNFGVSGGYFLNKIIKENKMLRKLDLFLCNLGDASIASKGMTGGMAEGLSINKTLHTINLGSNNLTDSSGLALAKIYAASNIIKWLHLGGNHFTDVSGVEFADMLIDHKSLRWLILMSNKLGDKSAKRFAKTLRSNQVLYVLWISFNNFSKEAQTALRETNRWKFQQKHQFKEVAFGNKYFNE